MMRVRIRGRGVAASCCAHLLERSGIAAGIEAPAQGPAPAILLSDPAIALLRDTLDRPGLLSGKPRITRRVVAWGGNDPVDLPHSAIVVGPGDLEDAFALPAGASDGSGADFIVHAAQPFPEETLRHFGHRQAIAAKVGLNRPEDAGACWIEAVERGWLFLIPTGTSEGWLLAVGAPLEALLGESRHVARRVTPLGPTSSAFDTCPRMLESLAGPDWLACGAKAIAFDPICGDGTAQAAREAILASAVIAAMQAGESREALLVHYESMLIASMRRHLRLCAQFYATGGKGRWWRDQLAALSEGFEWCTARLAALPEPRYELQGFELVARSVAA